MKKIALLALSFVVIAGTAYAQQPGAAGAGGQQQRQRREPDPRDMGGGQCAENPYNCKDAVNPLPAPSTVWLEEMTWMDVRDALKAGKTSIIIATGGMEPNGPWLVTGKHNYVLHANCEAIARKLGNALCAPIVKFVPEGDIEKKTGHMVSPGTISMREETFRGILRDTAESLQAHGFKNIIFIGDSGGNQAGQKAIAEELTKKWAGQAMALHVAEYYTYGEVAAYMKEHGIVDGKSDNMHDDPIITLNMFIDDPNSVRFNERVKAGKATINGVNVGDKAKNTALAKQIVEFRATRTVDAINKLIAAKKPSTSSQD
jgi:creatinine amidohydrolase/Fe(II)-dependent formamide hydrolase-like protein